MRIAKILLVEDDEFNRDMLLRRLNRRGFTVVEAVSSNDGCTKAAQQAPT